jgi:hypothetical protein
MSFPFRPFSEYRPPLEPAVPSTPPPNQPEPLPPPEQPPDVEPAA